MKLNIGSNTQRHNGFLNLDMRDCAGVDIVDDAATLSSIEDGSCSAIIAHNILEHFSYDRTLDVLGVWVSKLQRGGVLSVGVPDAELIFDRYKAGKITRGKYRHAWDDLNHSLFGNMDLLRSWHGEDADKYGHHAVFCEDSLRHAMESCGLTDIRKVKANHPDNITLEGVKA